VLGLLRVQHLVVAVNKIDLVGYDEHRFTEIADAVRDYVDGLGLTDEIGVTAVPLSALEGDNVSERSLNTPWYDGPPLLELLETLPIAPQPGVTLRLPVQWVAPADGRGPWVAGSVTAGVLHEGEEVLVLPAGRRARVVELTGPAGPLDLAGEEAAVSFRLHGVETVARGDVLVPVDRPPQVARTVFADVAVTDDRRISAGERLRVRLASAEVCGTVEEVVDRLDIGTGRREPADGLELNDIGRVRLSFDEPLPVDPYARHRSTGGLLLLDEESGDVRAGVLVREALEPEARAA
jgi:sulfate adenylyltransferase subunit 1 (EFTu-like GTPase family)